MEARPVSILLSTSIRLFISLYPSLSLSLTLSLSLIHFCACPPPSTLPLSPQEAVLKLFQRALSFCDPKKLYLALLAVYERTEQHGMADDLLRTMARKFNTSAKVRDRRTGWLAGSRQSTATTIVPHIRTSLYDPLSGSMRADKPTAAGRTAGLTAPSCALALVSGSFSVAYLCSSAVRALKPC